MPAFLPVRDRDMKGHCPGCPVRGWIDEGWFIDFESLWSARFQFTAEGLLVINFGDLQRRRQS